MKAVRALRSPLAPEDVTSLTSMTSSELDNRSLYCVLRVGNCERWGVKRRDAFGRIMGNVGSVLFGHEALQKEKLYWIARASAATRFFF